jgi:DNA-binding CsgD family transcriptional regulator
VLLGPRGGIDFANEVARCLLRQPPAEGRPHYWTAIRVVTSLLARSLGPEPSLAIPAIEVVDPEQRQSYRVRAERVQQLDGSWRNLVLIEPQRPADRTDHLEALGLTPREAEVSLAVVRGLSTKEIVAELRLSPHTVQTHLKNVFEKLGVGSRRELAAALGGVSRHHPD